MSGLTRLLFPLGVIDLSSLAATKGAFKVLAVVVLVILRCKVQARGAQAAWRQLCLAIELAPAQRERPAVAAEVALGEELHEVVLGMAADRAASTDAAPSARSAGIHRLADVAARVGAAATREAKGDGLARCFLEINLPLDQLVGGEAHVAIVQRRRRQRGVRQGAAAAADPAASGRRA